MCYADTLRPGAVRRCTLLYLRWVERGDERCLLAALHLANVWDIGTLEMR